MQKDCNETLLVGTELTTECKLELYELMKKYLKMKYSNSELEKLLDEIGFTHLMMEVEFGAEVADANI